MRSPNGKGKELEEPGATKKDLFEFKSYIAAATAATENNIRVQIEQAMRGVKNDVLTVKDDIRAMIKDEIKPFLVRLDNVEKDMGKVKLDMAQLKKAVDERPTGQDPDLLQRLEETERRQERLDIQLRKCNLIFRGIKEDPNETEQSLKSTVSNIVVDKLGLSAVKLAFAYRIPKAPVQGKTRIICVGFGQQSDREAVFRARLKLRQIDGGSNIYISLDEPKATRERKMQKRKKTITKKTTRKNKKTKSDQSGSGGRVEEEEDDEEVESMEEEDVEGTVGKSFGHEFD